jgi:hypothetical protein
MALSQLTLGWHSRLTLLALLGMRARTFCCCLAAAVQLPAAQTEASTCSEPPSAGSRRRNASLLGCLSEFFASEAISWHCPRGAAARAAGGRAGDDEVAAGGSENSSAAAADGRAADAVGPGLEQEDRQTDGGRSAESDTGSHRRGGLARRGNDVDSQSDVASSRVTGGAPGPGGADIDSPLADALPDGERSGGMDSRLVDALPDGERYGDMDSPLTESLPDGDCSGDASGWEAAASRPASEQDGDVAEAPGEPAVAPPAPKDKDDRLHLARKEYRIHSAPALLTVHLKRFQQVNQ